MKSIVLLTLFILLEPSFAGTIYKYIDASGTVTYTNIPFRGATPLHLPAPNTFTPLPKRKTVTPAWVQPPTANTFVDNATQRLRDAERRKILQQELSKEENALQQARRALQEGTQQGPAFADRLQQLKDAVTDREKNISAIQSELSRIAPSTLTK